MPIQLLKLDYAIKTTCIPSWIVRLLVDTFVLYASKPNEATQFIVDMQKESHKRNKTIDLDKIKELAELIRDNQSS